MKKIFTLIAMVCLTAISAMAAKVTEVTDIEAAIANNTVVNLAIGDQYLYGSSAQNTAMADANTAKASTNGCIGYKIEKDGDNLMFRCVTPAGGDYMIWGRTEPNYLNAQTPVGGVTFNLNNGSQKGTDMANGAVWTLVDGALKNVGNGGYFNGTKTSADPVQVKIVTIEADPEPTPEPLVIPEALQTLITNKTIFSLKSGDSYVYGTTQQNVAVGTWEQACDAANNATNYVLEADEYYYYLRAVKGDGSDISAWGTKPCWLNTTAGGVIFEMGKNQDMKNGSSWLIEEVSTGKYSIKNVAKNGYMAINGAQANLTANVVNTWEFYVPAEPVEYTVNAKVTVDDASKKFNAQVIKVLEGNDGVATVTLPAAQAGAYKMASQDVKVNIDEEGKISMVADQKLNFTDGTNTIVVTVTGVEGALAEGKVNVTVTASGDNGKDVKVIYSTNEIVDPQPATRELTKDMFLSWNGFDENATVSGTHPYWDAKEMGTTLGEGGVVYGSGNVTNSDYANLTGVEKVIIKGTAGTPLRWMMNRQADNSLTDLRPTIGENGEVEIDLTGYTYVHLNAIKINWGGNGSVDSITLVGSEEILNNITTGVVNAKAEVAKAAKVAKFVKNGKVVIVKEGKAFTAAGAQM